MKILMTTLVVLICLIDMISGQACSNFGAGQSVNCNAASACQWTGSASDGQCNCASEVKLDILFGIDTSGSIGRSGFQIQKQFVKGLVDDGVANGTRIGFYMFNTVINRTKELQFWDKTVLGAFAEGMWWSGGWTNTPQLISYGLEHFAATFDAERQQIFLIITDGNPCLPDSQGGCPQTACQYKTQVFQAGVRVVVIGVGDGLNSKYVKCLTQSDSDWIPVSGYSEAAFATILGSLSEVLCPVSKEFKVTEVKASRKSTYSLTDSRLTRFVEVYNSGIDFNVSDIGITGLIEMTRGNGPAVTVTQSQYLVFYDASEAPLGTAMSTPTCHLCEWSQTDNRPCDLSACSTWAGNKAYTGTCFCGNSIYIACRGGGTAATCSQNAALSGSNVYDGCSACEFSSDADQIKDNWDITFSDATMIDTVDYGATGTGSWISVIPGYSLELAWKGFDNDYGTSWIQSCSSFGTPGSDPYAQCEETCVTLGSDCGGTGTCDASTGQCLCDATTGYYPSCQSPGVGCFQCAQTPEVSDCVVVWRKNGTEKYAYYNWTTSAPSVNGGFFLQYFDSSKGGSCPTGVTGGGSDTTCDVTVRAIGAFNKDNAIYSTSADGKGGYARVNNYYASNDTIGGYVYAFEAVCDTSAISTATTCQYYVSQEIPCVVITAAPTLSPTMPPTDPPTPKPSPAPTMSPTYSCPRYWIDNDAICNSNTKDGYTGDRCFCTGKSTRGDTQVCCLLNPDFTTKYDEDRQHKTTEECKMDTQLENGKCRYNDDCEAGSSEGYLLSTGDHSFEVAIDATDSQQCLQTVCWQLKFTETDCNYESSKRRLADSTISDGVIKCDPESTSLAAAGLSIDVTSGCLKIWRGISSSGEIQTDSKNATIDFKVTRLTCEKAEAALAADTSTRRRLAEDCFGNIAIKGELVLVNATSSCQPDCTDGRIYPMRFPVWYNYAAAFVAPPAEEKELPAWLWWLIAALVVFLALLALLVYKYWWKNKATGAALGATQADLDAAVMENEQGFGGDLGNGAVGFNPLATGFNPNAPAGPMNPNAPPHGGGRGGDFVRPVVEPIVFKQEFGPQHGGMR
eukprot:CAMPEP_0201594858 /NCGR_PEP_ID=MMETSP0190_2-20130828/192042_1 /ASSEMBLY_ACC=CAM_ASM_000263 /TAXON_ID=37353 /ORGANISM="Rosalina sp." /LENGTH=1076 /DNA_ID=CAMNT_0048054631 /DNA_START=134 /DNA_END=3364 /DNA_ORIENTATION=+